METKKVAKEYLQKDILRTIFQMRKRQEDDKQIKRIIVLDYDLTEYHWKTNIKKLQEEGFLETDSDAKIPALTESGTEYARQLQRAAEGWNQFLQMSGVDEKTVEEAKKIRDEAERKRAAAQEKYQEVRAQFETEEKALFGERYSREDEKQAELLCQSFRKQWEEEET